MIMESWPTITYPQVLESTNSELESADSNADSAKVGVWVRALIRLSETAKLYFLILLSLK